MRYFPGFGPSTKPPTPDLIADLKARGVLSHSLSCYADVAHFNIAGGMNNPPPTTGPFKYWCNPQMRRPPAYLYLKQTSSGDYIKKPVLRDAKVLGLFGAICTAALGLIESRHLLMPELELVEVPYAEQGRLSFPAMPQDAKKFVPVQFPFAEVWGWEAAESSDIGGAYTWYPYVDSTFPSDTVVFFDPLKSDQPLVMSQTEFMAEYPWWKKY